MKTTRVGEGVSEAPFVFDCDGDELVGVISVGEAASSTGVLIVVGGPQYRVGSHRQFVLLARALAAAGYATLRFDYRGMGDAAGASRSFVDTGPDIDAAIGVFQRIEPKVERVVIWGLCDAAAAALIHAARDPRVAGLILLNPWVRSEATLAKTHLKHYYGARLLQPEFWRKLTSGRFDFGAAAGSLWSALRSATGSRRNDDQAAPFQRRMANGWRYFRGPILLILSGQDLTAREFLEYVAQSSDWDGMLEREGVSRFDLKNADHTFSTREWRGEVERVTIEWVRAVCTPKRSAVADDRVAG